MWNTVVVKWCAHTADEESNKLIFIKTTKFMARVVKYSSLG